MAGDEPTKINMKICLENIGPHKKTIFEQKDLSAVNMGIYADNGGGKSFISKTFRQFTGLENAITGETEEERQSNQSEYLKKINSLLTFDTNNAKFSFVLSSNKLSDEKSLNVDIIKDEMPKVENKTDFIFHTFNSDYVKEHLEVFGYKPDDNIEGFILGKANIDLSKEKKKLDDLKDKGSLLKSNILENIEKRKSELKKNGVYASTTEYKNISFDNISNGVINDEPEKFEALKEKCDRLSSMPDDLQDVLLFKEPEYSFDFKQVSAILSKQYTLSHFAEEFKQKIRNKQDFIELGLKLLPEDKTCPFCEQSIAKSESALSLISSYNEFLKDEESIIINEINTLMATIDKHKENLSILIGETYNKIALQFSNIKKYIPSFESKELEAFLSIEHFNICIDEIMEMLKHKKENISISEFDYQDQFNYISEYVESIKQNIIDKNNLIDKINMAKNDIKSERLTLRKRLCNACFNDILIKYKTDIETLQSLREEYLIMKKSIQKKEEQVQADKRALVIKDMKHYLHFFFNNKYEFDEDSFCVKFGNKHLIDNAENVLSDGEKSIVAFCYYLSTIHSVIKSESDYNKLFFIIDDPVSSMDFHYVYSVAQCIKDLKISINSHYARYIILKHNMEFMSILIRNKIICDKFVLSKGSFKKLKNELIMPYEANLQDVYSVANMTTAPTHTTPNSIRHILETIHRFECSNCNFSSFILSIEGFKGNGFINVLINDLSHGILREQKPYTDDMIISACKNLIDFIRINYSGQIINLEK